AASRAAASRAVALAAAASVAAALAAVVSPVAAAASLRAVAASPVAAASLQEAEAAADAEAGAVGEAWVEEAEEDAREWPTRREGRIFLNNGTRTSLSRLSSTIRSSTTHLE